MIYTYDGKVTYCYMKTQIKALNRVKTNAYSTNKTMQSVYLTLIKHLQIVMIYRVGF